ncbi:hypothetical protein BDR07DRAFT_1392914 [Suillus spraguei]|nr:hypothetical protein BDR07DRAFT_1392914 [Suillus spraguei]
MARPTILFALVLVFTTRASIWIYSWYRHLVSIFAVIAMLRHITIQDEGLVPSTDSECQTKPNNSDTRIDI